MKPRSQMLNQQQKVQRPKQKRKPRKKKKASTQCTKSKATKSLVCVQPVKGADLAISWLTTTTDTLAVTVALQGISALKHEVNKRGTLICC
jgi:hypothetical protein